jgi:hypothetical protein
VEQGFDWAEDAERPGEIEEGRGVAR